MHPLEFITSAFGTILAQRSRSVLTTLGVVIGVASVVLLISLAQGASLYLANSITGLGSNIIQAAPGHRETRGFGGPSSTTNKLTMRDVEELERRSTAFAGITPFVQGAATYRYKGRARDSFVLGIDDEYLEMRQFKIEQGRNITPEDLSLHRKVAIVGNTIRRELFGAENPLGQKIKIGESEYRIVGVTAGRGTTLSLDFDDVAFVPSTSAMDLFDLDGVTLIIAQARNAEQVALAKEQMKEILINLHNNEEDFTIFSPDDVLSFLGVITGAMTALLGGIASISLVVGGIGIMNIMLVSVTERTREIGVRRALGATKREILLQFLFESIAVSMLGGIIGLAIGAGIASIIHAFVPELPVAISAWLAVIAFGFSILVGVLSGVLPAMRAARLDPVDALRYE